MPGLDQLSDEAVAPLPCEALRKCCVGCVKLEVPWGSGMAQVSVTHCLCPEAGRVAIRASSRDTSQGLCSSLLTPTPFIAALL